MRPVYRCGPRNGQGIESPKLVENRTLDPDTAGLRPPRGRLLVNFFTKSRYTGGRFGPSRAVPVWYEAPPSVVAGGKQRWRARARVSGSSGRHERSRPTWPARGRWRRPATRWSVASSCWAESATLSTVGGARRRGVVVETLRGIPSFVDKVDVVDDASRDATGERARELGDPRIEVIRHESNQGVGAAILTGYRRALEEELSSRAASWPPTITCTRRLGGIVEPVARGEVEYAKANRLVSGEAWTIIPRTRYLGNAGALSLLTKIASVATGPSPTRRPATPPSRGAAARSTSSISTGSIRATGFPNDMLVQRESCRTRASGDVPSRPIYHEDGAGRDQAALRDPADLLGLLFKAFWWRLGQKYADPVFSSARVLLHGFRPAHDDGGHPSRGRSR